MKESAVKDYCKKHLCISYRPSIPAETIHSITFGGKDSPRFGLGSAASISNLLGYATFPSSYRGNPRDDGVVVRFSTLSGGSTPNFNLGQTLTHEVGHWVGLYHTFQDGCTGSGDLVADTPPEATPALGCPISRDTCPGGGPDPIHNYMDYSDNFCLTEFTPSQISRALAQIATYRGL
ncbi:hypothetical protein AX16_000212 [Volvariella volvacea WC 439]|nr:hypothetical protein AX16_000212 [Volvariella volvacea WC 439]